jgi:hypothetical protein
MTKIYIVCYSDSLGSTNYAMKTKYSYAVSVMEKLKEVLELDRPGFIEEKIDPNDYHANGCMRYTRLFTHKYDYFRSIYIQEWIDYE